MTSNIDLQDLRAFAIVANELNMRRAAEILHISQPPLSRKIVNLERRVGVKLFIRHNYGLELTPAGQETLTIIQPLLALAETTQNRLAGLTGGNPPAIGLTTAFEQGVYTPVINFLKCQYGKNVVIKRATSISLARDVARGKLLTAFVALPMQMSGVSVIEINYAEQMLAAMPDAWCESVKIGRRMDLRNLNDRPFFWFSSCHNPFWHRKMQSAFMRIGFVPHILEEPLEHDVLLARISQGEAFCLMPGSFAAIQRQGIRFVEVYDLPSLEMGMIFQNDEGKNLACECAAAFRNVEGTCA